MPLPARRAGQLVLALATAGLVSLTGTGVAHADLPPDELRRVTDRYLFDVSLDSFIDTRAQQPHAEQLDWTSDSCSWSPDEPVGYEFDPGCKRHDFGYRNYQAQDRFTEDNRLRIDNNFRSDLYSICDGDWTCEGVADVYYNAVREFGGAGTTTAEALERGDVETKTRRLVETYEELRGASAEEARAIVDEYERENGVDLTRDVPVPR